MLTSAVGYKQNVATALGFPKNRGPVKNPDWIGSQTKRPG